MNSLPSRILTALALGPMTAQTLAKMLSRDTEYVRDALRGLRKAGKVRLTGVERAGSRGPLADAYGLPCHVLKPEVSRKLKRTHPWVQAGKVAIEERS